MNTKLATKVGLASGSGALLSIALLKYVNDTPLMVCVWGILGALLGFILVGPKEFLENMRLEFVHRKTRWYLKYKRHQEFQRKFKKLKKKHPEAYRKFYNQEKYELCSRFFIGGMIGGVIVWLISCLILHPLLGAFLEGTSVDPGYVLTHIFTWVSYIVWLTFCLLFEVLFLRPKKEKFVAKYSYYKGVEPKTDWTFLLLAHFMPITLPALFVWKVLKFVTIALMNIGNICYSISIVCARVCFKIQTTGRWCAVFGSVLGYATGFFLDKSEIVAFCSGAGIGFGTYLLSSLALKILPDPQQKFPAFS